MNEELDFLLINHKTRQYEFPDSFFTVLRLATALAHRHKTKLRVYRTKSHVWVIDYALQGSKLHVHMRLKELLLTYNMKQYHRAREIDNIHYPYRPIPFKDTLNQALVLAYSYNIKLRVFKSEDGVWLTIPAYEENYVYRP